MLKKLNILSHNENSNIISLSTYPNLLRYILLTIQNKRQEAVQKLHQSLVELYWEIGCYIVIHVQENKKAEYGEEVLQMLSKDLQEANEHGYSIGTLKNIRQFYLTYPKQELLRSGIKWSHYLYLMRLPEEDSRRFYEEMILKENWTIRDLTKQIQFSLYERTISQQKEKHREPLLLKAPKIEDTIKDPYILDFLQLESAHYQESDLEKAIISNMEKFLLELGYGFSFSARQKRIQMGNQFYYVDLVFFHRGLRCTVLIDLKIGKFVPADVGQMNAYRNYFRENERYEWEEEPIGIILCADKDDEAVHYALGDVNQNIFVSRYKTFLPSEDILKQRLTSTKRQYFAQQSTNINIINSSHPRKEIILEHFKKEIQLSIKDYQIIADVSRATAHRDLATALKEGWLKRFGKTRSAYYTLVDITLNTEKM